MRHDVYYTADIINEEIAGRHAHRRATCALAWVVPVLAVGRVAQTDREHGLCGRTATVHLSTHNSIHFNLNGNSSVHGRDGALAMHFARTRFSCCPVCGACSEEWASVAHADDGLRGVHAQR